MNLIPLIALTLVLSPGQQKAPQQSDEIDEDDIRDYLAKQSDCQPEEIRFSTIEAVDFLKVGYDQVVVVASTCMTGTAGPDIHAVYTRDEDGEIKELAIQELKLPHRVLFGNTNSEFRIGDGVLVEVYGDTSEREDPLVVNYKWNAQKELFEIVSMEAAEPFKTSYDCGKAEKDGDETALAICYVEPLANLDLELARRYKAYLGLLNEDEKKKEVETQRAWLSERNKNCGIFKFWLDCLEEAYKKRIAELEAKQRQKEKKANAQAPSQ